MEATLERLRNETKTEHQQLEKMVIPFIRASVNYTAYSQLLKTFYGYFMPVEEQIAKFVTDEWIPAFSQRRNANYILQDLQAIGQPNAALNTCTQLPAINSVYAALGALYVLEGSTQGGKIISKMLVANMQLPDFSAVRFFSGYGEQSDTMWHSFTGALNNLELSANQQDEIIRGATETFVAFKNWVKQQTENNSNN